MKTKFSLTITALFIGLISIAQDNDFRTYNNLENYELKRMLGITFSKIVTGQATNTPGKYASLDIEKSEAKLGTSFILNDRNLLSFRFQGGATDGVSSVFNNSRLNTNVSLEAQYNLMICKKGDTVRYYTAPLKSAQIALIETYRNAIKEYLEYAVTNKVFNERISKHLKKLDDVTTTKIDAGLSINERQKIITTLEDFLKEVRQISTDTTFNSIKLLNIANSYINIRNEAYRNFSFTAYTLNWLTFGAKIRNDDFRLIDTSALFESQIRKTNFLSPEFSAQFSHYRYSEINNSLYYAVALSYAYKSNYLELDKTTVKETTEVGTSGTTTRDTEQSYIAYSGNYIDGLSEISTKADLYYYPWRIEVIGFHVFQNSRFTEKVKPLYDLGFGIVIPFEGTDEKKSVVNAEIYYNIKNVFNTNGIGYSFIERNDIGLRFTFPINFKN